MKKYDPKTFTYGIELEAADMKFGSPLPAGASWNEMDNTIVNSNGIANDPKGKLWAYGGEINTKPTNTVDEQVEHIFEIVDMLDPKPVMNYRCNLHVHVRVPGLSEDLEACKNLLKYVMCYGKEAFGIIEDVPKPVKGTMSVDAYDGAMKRYKRRFKSHQYELPDSRVQAMLAAKTVKEFYEEHAPLTEKGRMWFFSPRAGINLRQMWEATNTIEFRHFPGTLEPVQMESCIRWCREFLDAALNDPDRTPRDIYESATWEFPKFEPYNHELEKMYKLTNHESNNRKFIAARIAEFEQTGN